MDKKLEFNEALSALIEYATVNGNTLTKDDIYQYFKDILDDEAKYQAVHQYLTANHIKIEGYTDVTPNDDAISDFTPDKIDDSEEGHMFLDMYYDDLKAISDVSEEDLVKLVNGAISKNKSDINALVEAFLNDVVDIAGEYEASGVKKSDLISEGNLGLLEAASSIEAVPANIKDYFRDVIRTSITTAIENEVGMLRISNHITERANSVSDAAMSLAAKLGREATMQELCEYVSLPEEKVREILKISLDATNLIQE